MASITAIEKTKDPKAKASDANVPKVITTIDKIKSRWSCPACEQKRLITLHTDNWTEPKRFLIYPKPRLKHKPKKDLIFTHHCLNCNFGLTENEARKEMRERKDKNKSDGDQPWAAGTFFLILMIGTILTITLYRDGQRGPSLVETIEQLTMTQPDANG